MFGWKAVVDIPHDSERGEFGYDTWLDESAEAVGNAGVGADQRR
jgi:hypothetical protein